MRDHTPEALRHAKRLRAEMSLPETILWRQLRQRIHGVKFRRQHPIGDYVVDFCCVERKLVVEIDAKSHDMGDRLLRDRRRDEWLQSQGLQVVRLNAEYVLRDVAAVAESLIMLCLGPPPPSAADAAATSPGGGIGRRRKQMNPIEFEVDILPLSAAGGGGSTAIAPELPGCRSDGETPQDALANIHDAIACRIEGAEEMGRAVPPPRRIAA